MERGLIVGILAMIFSYPFLFLFGVNKWTTILLLYLLPLVGIISSYQKIRKGNYRVVTSNGEFVSELIGENKDFLIFKDRVIKKSEVVMMEITEIKKEKNLYEYSH